MANVPSKIQTWQMTEPGKLARTEIDVPQIQPGEVLVDIAGCGVCHTDLGYFYDGVPTVSKPPMTLGHEISGKIIAGDSKWVGKEVIIPAVMPCNKCPICAAGRGNRRDRNTVEVGVAEVPDVHIRPLVGPSAVRARELVAAPGVVPERCVRGGRDLNIVAVTEGGAELQGWNQTGSAETLLAGFTRWTKDSKSLLERATGWRSWSLYRLTGLRRFSEGRIALLGDAAHPVLPYLAQGAALAIEDAVTLAACIEAWPGDPPAAFRRYEGLRRPRVARVQRLSRRFGWLYHLRGPLRPARNLILERRSEERALQRFDWLYRHEDERA